MFYSSIIFLNIPQYSIIFRNIPWNINIPWKSRTLYYFMFINKHGSTSQQNLPNIPEKMTNIPISH